MFQLRINIFTFLIIVCMGLTSCIYDSFPEETPDYGTSIVMRLSPLSMSGTRADYSSLPEYEKVKTLRVIVCNADGVVEANRYYQNTDLFLESPQSNPVVVVAGLTPGQKSVWVIANEEGVGPVIHDGSAAGDAPATLGALLEEAQPGSAGFEDMVMSVRFTSYASNGRLPYSTRYDVALEAGRQTAKTFYLVPAATKFSVEFFNYRSSPVKVNSVGISSIADRCYLMAHVGPSDSEKVFADDAQTYPWVEWLAKVSELSWNAPGMAPNASFNERYGWISDYQLPAATIHALYTATINADIDPIDEGAEGASALIVYLPESRNKLSGSDMEQAYYLKFDIEDTTDDFKAALHKIDNLQSLFRDTYVRIKVRFRDSSVNPDITVDVDPWDESDLNPELGILAWDHIVDVDPWDEGDLNPDAGKDDKDLGEDVDPWDEGDLNPDAGKDDKDLGEDVDPWDEGDLNPDAGKDDKDLGEDVDPWDEGDLNPDMGEDNKDLGEDVDPWDEGDLNPDMGEGNQDMGEDVDPWDEEDLNPSF